MSKDQPLEGRDDPDRSAVLERATVVDAPLSSVWEFHTSPESLLAFTPGWFGLDVDVVVDPNGDGRATDGAERDRLREGTEITLTACPLGRLPCGSARFRIEEYQAATDGAWFRDRMIEGPLAHWEHTHRFHALEDRTILVDRVAFSLGAGLVGRLDGLVRAILYAAFVHRHRRTRTLLADR